MYTREEEPRSVVGGGGTPPYTVRSGFCNPEPTDPIKRAEYFLEQMRVYLDLHMHKKNVNNEYHQIEIIFNALLNVITETNYKILADTLCSTGKRVNASYTKSSQYWNEFLKFMHYKLTGRTY